MLINLNINQAYLLIDEKYADGVLVVLMISIAKLYTMSLGNNGAIISNSKYYKILLPYAIAMALSVYFLNDWLISVLSMDGAALSTLVVILIFNTIKVWYVQRKFNMQPYSIKTLLLFLLICIFFAAFYSWDFTFHPIINIVLKTTLITIVYVFLVFKLKISIEINNLISKFIKSNQ